MPAADTVSCGDAMMDAQLASQLHPPRASIQTYLRQAVTAVVLTAMRVDAYTDTQAEIDALLQVHVSHTPETG